jgi:hypothetical protein
MRSLKSQCLTTALTTLETVLKQTKEARVLRRAHAVREVVAGQQVNTVSTTFHFTNSANGRIRGGKYMRTRGIYSPVLLITLMLLGTPAVQADTNQNVQGLPALQEQVATLATALQAAQQTMQTLQQQVEQLTQFQLTQFMHVEEGDLNGLKGPHLIIEGANLHVRSGSGATAEGGNLTGLGNVVIGYNEPPLKFNPGDRDGSHNLIIGREHRYKNFAGLVAGFNNTLSGPEASVSGGAYNTASGKVASVSGGRINKAVGFGASVCGGLDNIASGGDASIGGGQRNQASGFAASISGGFQNTAQAFTASVSGGYHRNASGPYDWAAGDLFETE